MGNDDKEDEQKMKRIELASTACPAAVLQGCKHLVRLVVWLGLLLGISVTCFSNEPLPVVMGPPTNKSGEHCQKLLVDVPISQLTVDIRPRDPEDDGHIVPEETLPEDCNRYLRIPAMYSSSVLLMARDRGLLRGWPGAQFCHRPLYFEDACLERSGVCHGCLQPSISGINFYGTALLLPVKMWHTPPHSYVRSPL